jgi:hypothetical protein
MNYLQLPVEVLPHLRRLSAVQLAIWADAWTWQQNGKEARRSNAQYGEMFGVHAKSISQSIAGLRDAGCIEWSDTGGGRMLRATIPTNVTPPYERVPSIGTSIHTNVDTPSIGTCTPPPYEHGPPLHTNVEQIEKVIEKVIEKEIEKRETKPKKNQDPVLMPFEGERFAEVWATWKTYKKEEKRFSYKSRISEQEALSKLQKLSNDNEQRAIEIIQQSIANGWSGFFALRDGGSTRASRTVDAASTLEWLKSPRRTGGYR